MLKFGIHSLNISDFEVLEVGLICSTGFGSAKTNFWFYVVPYVVFCCKIKPHHCTCILHTVCPSTFDTLSKDNFSAPRSDIKNRKDIVCRGRLSILRSVLPFRLKQRRDIENSCQKWKSQVLLKKCSGFFHAYFLSDFQSFSWFQ